MQPPKIHPSPSRTPTDTTLPADKPETVRDWRRALSFQHDGVITATDIIDLTFYLGIEIPPSHLVKILAELNTNALSPPVFTKACFRGFSPWEVKAKMHLHATLVTRGSLLLGQHILERFIMTVIFGIGFSNNHRYTPLRHEAER